MVKANPDATLAFCTACHRDMPCGCASGAEVERLRGEVANLCVIVKVREQLGHAHEKVIAALELRLGMLERDRETLEQVRDKLTGDVARLEAARAGALGVVTGAPHAAPGKGGGK